MSFVYLSTIHTIINQLIIGCEICEPSTWHLNRSAKNIGCVSSQCRELLITVKRSISLVGVIGGWNVLTHHSTSAFKLWLFSKYKCLDPFKFPVNSFGIYHPVTRPRWAICNYDLLFSNVCFESIILQSILWSNLKWPGPLINDVCLLIQFCLEKSLESSKSTCLMETIRDYYSSIDKDQQIKTKKCVWIFIQGWMV